MKKVLVLGEEVRQDYLYRLLKEKGYAVKRSKELIAGDFDVFLLPVPAHLSEKYVEALSGFGTKGQYIFGCDFSKINMAKCPAKFVDYMKGDETAYRNAVATAEGAIAEAISHSNTNLHHSKSLVIGYGRCGSVLADKLLALRSQVTVLEQDKKKCAQAESKGLFVMNKKEDKKKFDYVFNTAPTHVADEKFLSELSREVTIIDIASKGTGVDFQYCKENQLNAHLCLGLPGKYAPKSSAAILLKVIEDTLGE